LEYSDADELQNWQREVADSILNGANVLSIAPTGSGKSHLGLWLTRRFERALWVLPTKALTREWFMKALITLKGVRSVNIYTGDYRRESNKYHGDLIFATYESALLQLRRKDEWFQKLELLIFDEFQFVGEDERGGVVEELLILLSELNPKTKILALSATVGNPDELVKWISRLFSLPVRTHQLPLSQRPIKLVQQALKFKGEKEKRRYLFHVMRSNPDEQFLVFAPRRFEAENLAKYYSSLGIKSAVHHAGLDRLSRISAEDGFRNGLIQALFCTATLQYGVNLPAHCVVIYDPVWSTRLGEFALGTNDYLQMAGRAGRPMVSPTTGEAIVKGKVLVFSTSAIEHKYVKFHLLNRDAEPVVSSFERDLIQRVHGLLLYRNADEVRKLLSKSFARLDQREVNNSIDVLRKMRFLKDGQLSSLGKFVAELNLNPFAASRFIRGLESWRSPNGFGPKAAQIVFNEVGNESSSMPPNIKGYRDLLSWRFVERPYLDGVLLMVNYAAPLILRDRAAWYMYSYEKLAEFLGFREHSAAIMNERFRLEGLNEYDKPAAKLASLLSTKKVFIEVAIRDYNPASNLGRASWLGLDVYVRQAPRGWTEPVEVVNLEGRVVSAVLIPDSALNQ
jgi:helicase